MGDKLRDGLDKFSEILERFMAVIVIIAVAVAIFSLWEPFLDFYANRTDIKAFQEFLARILDIVIGIEFFKMLCKPGTGTVLEVSMFCIARHMIVHDTSAVENLLTIIGIAIILLVKKFLQASWKPRRKKADAGNEKDTGQLEIEEEIKDI